jgi:hypothetical protein
VGLFVEKKGFEVGLWYVVMKGEVGGGWVVLILSIYRLLSWE